MVHSDDVSLDHLTRGQIAALLELAEDAARSHSSLPALVTRIPDVLSRLAILHVEDGRGGEGVLADLLRPETGLGSLRHDKEVIKRGAQSAADEESRACWTLLYHVAIAAAYARHGVNISSHSIESRLGLYEDIAATTPHAEIGQVFRAALERARADGM